MIANILPQGDKIVILKVPGTLIKDMLENAVSAYPKLDGRFGAFAGVKFSFDQAQPAGSRVHRVMFMNGEPFDFSRSYNVAMKYFISLGRDGYTCFQDPRVSIVRDVNDAELIQGMVLEHMRRFGPEYTKMPIAKALEFKIDPQHVERRQIRMKLFHTYEKNTSPSGHIKIAPKIEGRITMAPKSDDVVSTKTE